MSRKKPVMNTLLGEIRNLDEDPACADYDVAPQVQNDRDSHANPASLGSTREKWGSLPTSGPIGTVWSDVRGHAV